MMCRHCGEKVRCAECGVKVNSSQTIAYRKRKRRGICARCPAKLMKRDLLLEHVHCFDCRLKQAERSRRRHATHGRKDRHARAAA